MKLHLAGRLDRSPGPYCVDQIFSCPKFSADRLCRFGKALRLFNRQQGRVETNNGPLFDVLLDPFRRGRLDQILNREDFGIRLVRRLKRIAAIDEQDSAVTQHDAEPGRPGEPGQPCQSFGVGRQIFVLVFVGVRHQPDIDAGARHCLAQVGYACSAFPGLALCFERLEHRTLVRVD